MKYIPIFIPVKPHIKKYIHALYGPLIPVSFKTFIGINVYMLLQKKNMEKMTSKKDSQVRYALLTDKIRFLVPRDLLYRTGINIPQNKILIINNLFEQQMSEHLYNFVEAYLLCGLGRKRGIEDFCKKFNIDIDIDITFDALCKSEYRRRKCRENNLNNNMGELSFTKS